MPPRKTPKKAGAKNADKPVSINRYCNDSILQEQYERILDKYITESKHILVVLGAGISVGAGIPDFRSKNGIYKKTPPFIPPFVSPEEAFSRDYFKENPDVLFKGLKYMMKNGNNKPTLMHQYLQKLNEKNQILRIYTQNIDMLEGDVFMKENKCVHIHGHLNSGYCTKCGRKVSKDVIDECIENGRAGICERNRCNGYICPSVCLYGDSIDDSVYTNFRNDHEICDLVIIIGTSLVVEPLVSLISQYNDKPIIIINKTCINPTTLWPSKKEENPLVSLPLQFQLLADCQTIPLYFQSIHEKYLDTNSQEIPLDSKEEDPFHNQHVVFVLDEKEYSSIKKSKLNPSFVFKIENSV